MQSAQNVAYSSETPKVITLLVPAAISQEELRELILLRNVLRQRGEQLAFLEKQMLAKLQAGAICESGVHIAQIKETWRRSISWKDVVMRLAERLKLNGEAYCSRVLASTKPSRSVSLDIN